MIIAYVPRERPSKAEEEDNAGGVFGSFFVRLRSTAEEEEEEKEEELSVSASCCPPLICALTPRFGALPDKALIMERIE